MAQRNPAARMARYIWRPDMTFLLTLPRNLDEHAQADRDSNSSKLHAPRISKGSHKWQVARQLVELQAHFEINRTGSHPDIQGITTRDAT